MINLNDVENEQKKWADGIIEIGKLKNSPEQCKKFTLDFLNQLYNFENGDVLFKPTLASVIAFRPKLDAALSYFLGGNESFPEDTGFALKPWSNVKFQNFVTHFSDTQALAMGYYFFGDSNSELTKVEYTFGYIKVGTELKINLHHSSKPIS